MVVEWHWMKIMAVSLAFAAATLGVLALPGCDEKTAEDVMAVKIDGKTFFLELAIDNASRVQGLSHRTHIEPDGGMLFAFPRADNRQFVMRHCVIPIDILFLDANGIVVAMHAMVPEEPQGQNEPDATYEARLKKYPSQFSSQFAIELAGGTLETLQVEEGTKIPLDLKKLKAIVR